MSLFLHFYGDHIIGEIGPLISIFLIFRDAWHNLGDMDKESAMVSYVDELKKVGLWEIIILMIAEKKIYTIIL